MGIGELAGLSAAALWAVSSLYWSSFRLTALEMNFCKSLLGALLVGIHLTMLAIWNQTPVLNADATAWGWLVVSALGGLAIGDTFFFRSLQILGPRRALMIATTSPLFVAVLGWFWLGENLVSLTIVGMLVTIFGIVVVLADRRGPTEEPNLIPGTLTAGVLCGILSAFCQGVGMVISKFAMRGSEDQQLCDPLEATFIRLLLSGLFILIVLAFQKAVTNMVRSIHRDRLWKNLFIGTILGTWLGIGASMVAINETTAAVAQTLMATCPLFAIPVLWFARRQPTTWMAVVGTVVAIGGVAMVLWPT